MKSKKRSALKELSSRVEQAGFSQKKLNPFDLKINRTKSKVINRKVKDDIGRPGVSKLKSVLKRNSSLLKEYKNRKKGNILIDCRIGEKSNKLSEEAKKILRFAAERKKRTKSNLFNLGDDFEEQLTHGGQSLTENDLFDDNPLSDDDEGESDAKLKGKFVSEAHFGGFLTKKDETSVDKSSMSRKEWIDHIVAESKKKKAERIKDKEYVQKVQMAMDEKYKDISEVLMQMQNKLESPDVKTRNPYDSLLMELKLDMSRRATPKERLKTEEEIILKEKRKLEELEKERLESIKPTYKPRQNHQSADALDDDDFYYEEQIEGNDAEDFLPQENHGVHTDPKGFDTTTVKKVPTDNLKQRTNVSEELKRIPYTFEVPQSYKSLVELLDSHSPHIKGVILERMVKCNHPTLDMENSKKLQTLLEIMIEYCKTCCTKTNNDGEFSSNLSVIGFHILKLAYLCPDHHKYFFNILTESLGSCVKAKMFPDLATLFLTQIFFKIYSSSQLNQVLLLYFSQIFTDVRIRSCRDLNLGLFMVSTATAYLEKVNRYSPEVINFVETSLSTFIKTKSTVDEPSLFLGSENSLELISPKKLLFSGMRDNADVSEQLQVDSLVAIVGLTRRLYSLHTHLSSVAEIFNKALEILKQIDGALYPVVVRDELEDLIAILGQPRPLRYLKMEKAKPKLLRLYEPKFDSHYDGNKHRNRGSLGERQKLMHKYKREMKGAVREMRKDNTFLSRVKLDEQRARDEDRREKVKRLKSMLSVQEGDFQKIKKKAAKLK